MRIQKDTGVFILTTPYVEGYQIVEHIGAVKGISIQGVHFFKDFTAYLSDKFGGRVRGYEASLSDAMDQAMKEMALEAKKFGANAVIGVTMNTGDLNGKMLMASVIGTAVNIIPAQRKSNTPKAAAPHSAY